MQLISILINDLSNPIEIQAWLGSNPTATVASVQIVDSRAFILYQ
jgi:hypothetical protein